MRACISVILLGLICLSGCALTKNARLLSAAKRGNSSQVSYLLRAGADIEYQDSRGMTAYMAASMNGHVLTMQLLKDAGARSIASETEINMARSKRF